MTWTTQGESPPLSEDTLKEAMRIVEEEHQRNVDQYVRRIITKTLDVIEHQRTLYVWPK